MKNYTFSSAEHKRKNPTTNYPKDEHKQFCKRCFAHNGKCPNTGAKSKDRDCQL